jgi:hypothetical protein
MSPSHNSKNAGTTYENDKRSITITDHVRAGDEIGAQVVEVHDGLMAKIFDPLYYRPTDGYGFRQPVTAIAETNRLQCRGGSI